MQLLTGDDTAAQRRYDSIRELCHDLRNPAATIVALVAAAETEPDLSAEVGRRLAEIVGEARRISELCRSALAASEPEVVSVHMVAAAVVDAARLTTDALLTVDGSAAFVQGNASELNRAVSNLVDNAIRAAGPGGRVRVRAEVDERVHLSVEDSGPGFGSAPPGSAGLGLRIAGRITAEHGGELTIRRGGALGGAVVTLTFPRAEPASRRVSAS